MSWGLEATHTWDSTFVMNDKDTWPKVRVSKIDGLHALSDFDDAADAINSRRGEFARASQRGGRTIVYSGSIQARTLSELRDTTEEMLAVFDPVIEKEMLIEPDPGYDSGSRRYTARAVALTIPDEQVLSPQRASAGHERDFVLTMRLSDPRIYDPTLATGTSSSGSVALTNRATNPRAGALATTGWTATGTVAFFGYALPFTDGLPAGVNGTGFLFWGDGINDRALCQVAVTSGAQYTASIYVAPQTVTGGSGVALQVRRADGTTVVGTSTVLTTVGGFTRLSVTFTAAATESYWVGVVQQTAAGATVAHMTGLQVETGATATGYFDGDMALATWAGTAHASTSLRKAYRTLVVNHAGTIETDPIITLYGDGTDVVVRHRELDKLLSFGTNDIGAGSFVVVNFKRRTIKVAGVNPAQSWLDRTQSDWWDEGVPGLLPGTNTIEYYRAGAGEMKVDHYPAYPA